LSGKALSVVSEMMADTGPELMFYLLSTLYDRFSSGLAAWGNYENVYE